MREMTKEADVPSALALRRFGTRLPAGLLFICGVWLTASAHAAPGSYAGLANPFPARIDDLFVSQWRLENSAPAAQSPGATSTLRTLEYNDLRLTSFVAARNASSTADYRTYFGVGRNTDLGKLAKVTTRAFYGTGTYDGSAVNGGALPDEVRSSGSFLGNWVGADWKMEGAGSARHRYSAGVEYRQQLGFEVLDLNRLKGRTVQMGTLPARNLGVVTRNDLSLTPDLAFKMRMRYSETVMSKSAIDPRAELVYKPARTATLRAIFDQSSNVALASQTAGNERVRTYEVAYENAFSSRNSGARARISHTWQETASWLSHARTDTDQRLTRMTLEVPVRPHRLMTAFELQHLDVIGAPVSQARPMVLGNFRVATIAGSRATHVSFSVNNVFAATSATGVTRPLSVIPQDGRSLRIDMTRKL